MRNLIFSLGCFLCFIGSSYAQSKHGLVWGLGAGGVIRATRFNLDNSIRQYYLGIPPSSILFDMSHSNICDTNGNLILLCDGHNIYDSNLNYIDNGKKISFDSVYNHDLGTGARGEQFSIILPLANNIYRVINLGYTDSFMVNYGTTSYFPPDRLLYHDVDMNVNGGYGKVVKKMQEFGVGGRFCYNGMSACRHANGKDWWLIKECFDSLAFYTYLCTSEGMIDSGIQWLSNLPVPYMNPFENQISFNHQGTKMLVAGMGYINWHDVDYKSKLKLFDFNRCTGKLSNYTYHELPLHDTTKPDYDLALSGGCFSPNDSFLYLTQSAHIAQYQVHAIDSLNGWSIIGGMDTTSSAFQGYANIYPAQDGKIYIGNWNGFANQMSVINKPNLKSVACEFCPKCLRYDSVYNYPGITQPPNMPNYALGEDSSSCWPLSNVQLAINKEQLKVYPNPAFSNVIIDVGELSKNNIYITNTAGQVLYNQIPKTTKTTIDVSQWASGVYFVRYGSAVKRLVVE